MVNLQLIDFNELLLNSFTRVVNKKYMILIRVIFLVYDDSNETESNEKIDITPITTWK